MAGKNGADRRELVRTFGLDTSELLDRVYDGVEFFDVGVHGVLAEVQLLGEEEYVYCVGTGDDDDSVLIGDDDVVRVDLDTVTVDGNVHASEAVVADRGGWDGAGRVDGEAYFFQLREIAHAAVDDGS